MAKQAKKQPSRKEKRRRRRRRILIFEVFLLLLLIVALFAWSKFGMITFDELSGVETNELTAETKELLKGYQNIAFFGVDNRTTGDYSEGRSDTIMICSINNDTKEVRIVSVYRDTLLDINLDDYRKATEGYNNGGVQNSINMLNRNLDLDISDYVAVDFFALASAIDAVGGIDLDEGLTEQEVFDMNPDTGTGHMYIGEVAYVVGKEPTKVEVGQTHLNGVQATAYCRVRYTEGDDYRRAERQRTVIGKFVDKAKQASIPELLALADALFPYISTSMTSKEIAALIPSYKDYVIAGTRGFPFNRTDGVFGSVGSVVVPCTLESNVDTLYQYLFGEEDHIPSNTLAHISDEIVDLTGMDEDDGIADEFGEGVGADGSVVEKGHSQEGGSD